MGVMLLISCLSSCGVVDGGELTSVGLPLGKGGRRNVGANATRGWVVGQMHLIIGVSAPPPPPI